MTVERMFGRYLRGRLLPILAVFFHGVFCKLIIPYNLGACLSAKGGGGTEGESEQLSFHRLIFLFINGRR